ncbi:MAG: hypothetical protein K9N23_01265, partial [Akkermansiaceae bacterium]|nr:hypothetical protein [Akkermansiaceae bacterium]
MNLPYFPIIHAVSALVASGALLVPAAALAQSTTEAGVQVLTRGPVHEAFAETVYFDPQPGLIVSAEPPAPIEELPPEHQLVGDNVTWIPGYWAWGDEQNDFIWISGIWRNLPPGRQWIPGYWSKVGDRQFQWTSGYWADSARTEVNYIATPPPANLDIGPNVAAPADDQSWIPGNWVWAENRYLWRAGYWLPLRVNWTWVPSRYCWSRRGYVYVDGYWDHAVANRGVIFAPVYFNDFAYASPGYCYTPGIVIALNVFADHLFMRPRYGHYYFGDYYASSYRSGGYYNSCWLDYRYRGYDPIYAYDRWQHRGDQGWVNRRRTDYNFFRDHEDVRPRHTYAAMEAAGRNRYNDGRNRRFATSLDQAVRAPAEGQRFSSLDQGRRQQFAAQGREVRSFGQARNQVEARSRDTGRVSSQPVAREQLTRSPVSGRQADRFASRDAPPRRPEARGTTIHTNPATRARQQPGTVRTAEARNLTGRQSSVTGSVNKPAAVARTTPSRSVPMTSTSGANRGGSDPNAASPTPQRQAQSTPQRQTSPTPQRQALPTPQRQTRPTPQRQALPQPQSRPTPQRQSLPTPQRQAQPQRQALPQPQSRPTPQRQSLPTPQRQAQPQRQALPQPQSRPTPQ